MAEAPVTLITGTSRGLGKLMAEHFQQSGHQVIGCSRSAATRWTETYSHCQLDITDEPAVLRLFDEIMKRYGRIDHLINNAGVASMNHILLTPMDTVRATLATNVGGTFLFCREAGRIMQRQKFGRIVNFGSVANLLNIEGEAIYAASKAAIESLTKVLARELGPFGVTVNAICPGPTPTDLIKHVPQEKIDKIVAAQAIPRQARVEDIIHAVDFFLARQSDFVTGQLLYLGGP
jgi:3-oxoacyl-[acyl-carrier protein] reductase